MLRLQTSNKQLTYNVADFLENLSITFGPGSSLLVNTAYDKENVEKYFTDRHHTETYLFIKEGVTNAMKHADASKIQIQVYLKEGNFHVSIADNGKGAEQTGKGIGMASMGERMKALGGKARFWTDAGMHVLGSFPAVAN
jgi:signal transduction histidine kinase